MSKQKRLQAGYAGHAVPAGQAKNAPEEGRMQQSRLISLIEETAPPALAAPWDKSGIQVASPRTEILHLAVSLDPAPDVVSAAVGLGADMLLTHHPLSLSVRFPDRLDGYRRTLALLLAHDMPHYAAHTSLDANPFGPSVWLSDELGLTGRSVLEATGVARLPDGREIAGGFGCVGDLPDAPAPEVFFMKMGELLSSCGAFRANLIGTLPECIRRVALCTGSGASLAEAAFRQGADIYITGDFKYHSALDLEWIDTSTPRPFAALDVGHFSLEEEMTRRFASLIREQADGLRVSFIPGRDPFTPLTLTSEPTEVSREYAH